MFDVFKHIKFIGISLSLLGLWSCSDDKNETPEINPGNQGKVTVRFCIPSAGPSFINSSTRAEEDEGESVDNTGTVIDGSNSYLTNGEGRLSNLYLVSVQVTNYEEGVGYTDTEKVVVTPLNVYADEGKIEKYDYYDVNLYPGHYRFYLFANTDLYVDRNIYNAGEIFTEETVKQIYLDYVANTPIRKGHIPMACLPKQIKYDIGNNHFTTLVPLTKPDGVNNDISYTVNITPTDTPVIYADMTFLCAKVRYTILFDATLPTESNPNGGISSGFGNNSIRFYVDDSSSTTPTAEKLKKRTYIDLESDESDSNFVDGSWNLQLNRYVWPEIGDKYPQYPAQELTPWTKTLDEWKANRQRAWQGIVYLPENDTQNLDHTVLKFPYIMDKYATGEEEYKDGDFNLKNHKDIILFGGTNKEQHFASNGYDSNSNYESYDPNNDWQQNLQHVSNPNHGIKRGYFYDVVARCKNPDEWDLKVIIYGRVEDWHDMVQTVPEGNGYGK